MKDVDSTEIIYKEKKNSFFSNPLLVNKFRNEQIDSAIDHIIKIAQGDYTTRLSLSGSDERIDSFRFAINLLSEELYSKKKELENKNATLKKYSHFIESVTEAISDFIYILDVNSGIILYTNHEKNNFFTQDENSLDSLNIEKLKKKIHPEDLSVFNASVNKIGEKGINKSCEFRVLSPNNEWIWVYQEITPFIINENDRIEQVLGKVTDINELKEKEQSIFFSEEKYKSLSESSRDAIVITNNDGKILSWNRGAENIYGFTEYEIIGNSIDTVIPDFCRDIILSDFYLQINDEKFDDNKTPLIEFPSLHKNGLEFPVEISLSIWGNIDEKHYIGAIIHDISERKKVEKELNMLSLVAKESTQSIFICNAKSEVEWINNSFTETTGYNAIELKGKTINELLNIISKDKFEIFKICTGLEKRDPIKGEISCYNKTGKPFWFGYDIVPVFDSDNRISNYVATNTDITRKKLLEKKLLASNDEKEVLLKEIHHRVKNNLQIINSLLDLQIRRNKDSSVNDILLNSKNRIKSISLIHEQLYKHDHLSKINFSVYLEILASNIANTASRHININIINQMDPLLIDVNTAIPLGLISNELILNAYKHSFNNRKEGSIILSFKLNNKKHELIIEDNGVGLPDDFEKRKGDSLGYKIVNSLIRQIDAEIETDSKPNKGTKISILF
ncbi:MAG: PAS domain S-box protein [Cyclobacteriaceae bacterium]|nr:PAS domain S-box protein [Cyclobacteriaceae bacterium]